MVRNVPKYRDAAMIEIKILKDLRKHFDETAPFVVLWDCFDFRNHVCMVFEPLGTSIYDFVSSNECAAYFCLTVAWQQALWLTRCGWRELQVPTVPATDGAGDGATASGWSSDAARIEKALPYGEPAVTALVG